MATHVPCKKNDASGYVFYVSLVSQADTKIFQANPTYAAGDIKVAVDDAAPVNVNAVAIDADFTKRVKITLSQAQTNGDNLTVICSDAAGAEWCDLTINIQTSAQTLDEIDVNIDDIETDTAVIGALGAGLTAITDKTNLIPADPATETNVNANETKIDAIKAETALIVADTDELQADDYPASIAAIKAETALIVADTNEVQVSLADGGFTDLLIDAIKAVTDVETGVKAAVNALNNLSAAQVNTEVDNALDTAIPGAPTADSINERIKTIDDHDLVTKIPGVVTAVGPTKVEMDNGHGLLATEAKQDIIDTNVDDVETDTGTTIPATITTLQADVTAVKAKTDNLPSGITKNAVLSNFAFLMVLLADHVSPAAGLVITAQISKDGGAFVGCTNAVAEVANGVYKIDLTAAEMNADIVVLKFTEATCDQRTITMVTS